MLFTENQNVTDFVHFCPSGLSYVLKKADCVRHSRSGLVCEGNNVKWKKS